MARNVYAVPVIRHEVGMVYIEADSEDDALFYLKYEWAGDTCDVFEESKSEWEFDDSHDVEEAVEDCRELCINADTKED